MAPLRGSTVLPPRIPRPQLLPLQSLDPSIRADVWPFLLEVFEPASTYAQRQQQHALMVRQYQQLLLQCQVRRRSTHGKGSAHACVRNVQRQWS